MLKRKGLCLLVFSLSFCLAFPTAFPGSYGPGGQHHPNEGPTGNNSNQGGQTGQNNSGSSSTANQSGGTNTSSINNAGSAQSGQTETSNSSNASQGETAQSSNENHNEGNSPVPADSEGEDVASVEPHYGENQNHNGEQSGNAEAEKVAQEKAEYENNVQEAIETFEEAISELATTQQEINSNLEIDEGNMVAENPIEMDLIVEAEIPNDLIQAGEEIAIEVTAGDPVVKATGQFVFSTNDFSIKYGVNDFNFSRTFLSSSDFCGAFGKNWFCPLDSKIILGTNALYAKEALNKIQNIQSEIEEKIRSAENSTSWTKKVYSDSRVKNLYDSYLQKLNFSKQSAESILQKAAENERKNSFAKFGNPKKSEKLNVNQILFIDSNGTEKIFVYDNATSSYKNENDKNISSIKLEQNLYKICYKNGFTKVFSANLLPEFFEDRYGSRLTFTTDSKTGRVQKIFHREKAICEFVWSNNGTLNCITENQTGITHRYEYQNENLCAYSNTKGSRVSYNSDSENDVTQIKKSNGTSVFISYARDSKNQKTVSFVKNEEGGTEKFIRDSAKNELRFFDADGTLSIYRFSDSNKIIEEVRSDGSFVKRQYNSLGDVISEHGVFGNKNFYYDKNRNLCKAVYSDSSYEEWTYYSMFNLLASYRDRDGNLTKYFYDNKGFCLRVERGGKTIFTFTRNDWGGVKNVSGINGSDDFSYNDSYLLSSDSSGVYKYNSFGELILFTTHEGYSWKIVRSDDDKNIKIISPLGLETQVFFDENKNCSKRIVWDSYKNQGFAERLYYDSRNLCTRVEQKEISSLKDDTTSFYKKREAYSYTKAGRLKTKTLFNYESAALLDGEKLQTEYFYSSDGNISEVRKTFLDSSGKQIGNSKSTKFKVDYSSGTKQYIVIDENGNQTIIAYNEHDSILFVKEQSGMRNQFAYSKAGKLISEKNLYGGSFFYTYDAATGFLLEQSDECGNTTYFNYYLKGNQFSKTKNNGYSVQCISEKSLQGSVIKKRTLTETVETLYDSLGRVKACIVKDYISGLSVESRYSYDNANRKVNIKTGNFSETFDCAPNGEILLKSKNNVSYKYDFSGRVKEIISADETFFVTYNCLNLPSLIQSKNRFTSFCYDVDGNLLKAEDAEGSVCERKYDSRGRIIFEKVRGRPKYFYEYDDMDFLICARENENIIEKRRYENEHKKIVITDGLDSERSLEFDSYGRAVKETNRLGKTASVFYDDKNASRTYTSFSGNKVTEAFLQNTREMLHTYSDGRTEKIAFDSFGNVISSKTQAASEQYSYLEGSVLSSEISNGITQRYLYDLNGRLLSVTSLDETVSFKYDSNGRIERLFGKDFGRNFLYNSFGEETFSLDLDKSSIEKSYDNAGRLVRIVQKDSNKNIIFAEQTIYDSDGRICAVFHTDGSFSLYTYDENGRLCISKEPYCKQFLLSAQKEFAECGLEYPVEKSGSEFISLPKEYFESYKNFLSAVKKENCLYKNSFEVWTEKYLYDKAGNRIQKQISLGTLQYSYDKENRLCRIHKNPNSKNGITFCYDDDGNLIERKSVYKAEHWKYNASSRVTEYLLLDFKNDSAKKLFYDYDALGRLSYVQDAEGLCVNYVYRGTSFDVLSEYVSKRKPRSQDFTAHTAIATSSDKKVARYASLEEQNKFSSSYKHLFSRCAFNRFFVFADGNLCFQKNKETPFSDSNKEIVSPIFSYCTDQRGSVRTLTSFENECYELFYGSYGDAFILKDGNEIEADDAAVSGITYQFNGKSYDVISASYNYGLRSYEPLTARFTSEDPIRDGNNWYAYCAGDPVNFVDKIGLEILPVEQHYNMSRYTDYLGNSKDTKINEQGCYLTSIANLLWNAENLYGTEFNVTGEDHVLAINSNKELFDGALLKFQNGMDTIFGSKNWERCVKSASESNNLIKKLQEYEKSDTGYLIAGVFDLSSATEGVTNHMVLISGCTFVEKADGTFDVTFEIVGTSNGDAARLKDETKKKAYCYNNLKEIRVVAIENYNNTSCGN